MTTMNNLLDKIDSNPTIGIIIMIVIGLILGIIYLYRINNEIK